MSKGRFRTALDQEPPKPTLNIDGLAEYIMWRVKLAAEVAMPLPKPLEFLSQKELAARLGVSPPTVILLRRRGIIGGVLIGNKWKFEVGEVWAGLKKAGKIDDLGNPNFNNRE